MFALLGSVLNMSTPSPLTRTRRYEAFIRAPAAAPTTLYGSVAAYRYGLQHIAGLAEFPEPSDSQVGEFGIVESGETVLEIAAQDPSSLYALRNQLVDVELVTRVRREDGTTVELVNERRGVVKKVTRSGLVARLHVADVDRSELDALVPVKTFKVADWPELFVDHVNRPVPQGVGTIRKVPLTYVVKTGGTWKYAACEVIGSTPTALTVYRDKRVVAATEYTTSTQTVGGTTYFLVNFTREQVDFQGRLYEITADLSCPGSRLPADELKRMLQVLNVAADPESFARAAAYHNVAGIFGDYGYSEQRTGAAIVEDILQLARGQLYRTPSGAYGLFVDRPREVRTALRDRSDLLEIEEYEIPEISKTISLEYRPTGVDDPKMLGKLSRTTAGANGEKKFFNPYIGDHLVADRHVSYLCKREQNRIEARGFICGVQLAAGDLVAIDSPLNWAGSKIFAAPAIARPADRNQLTLREYVEDVYAYTAGTLPADATSGYGPDYSFTPPAAPTGLQVVSQGTSADTDGKVTAFTVVRAVPPSVNWAQLFVQLTDTTTGEQYTQELFLVSGNYDATFSGLRPNRLHAIRAWAVNATNMEGAAATIANFNTANATTALAAPVVTVTQVQSREVKVELAAVADVAGQPKLRRYILFESVSGGAYTEVKRSEERTFIRTVSSSGTLYAYKARSEDINGNESADSSSASITSAKMVDDTYIPGQGISGASIANGSINRGRSSTGTGSISGTSFPGANTAGGETYCFWINLGQSGTWAPYIGLTGSPTDDQAIVNWNNTTGSNQTFYLKYRYFNP